MSELEGLASPILSSMIKPSRDVDLSADQQVVIAAWLWKLAIEHEHIGGGGYFDEGERRCLMRGDAPPTGGVHMWLAAHSGSLLANLKGGPATFSAPDGRTTYGFLMSMSLRRFAGQVLCVREMPGVNVHTVARFNFEGAETLVWPEAERAVRWPPSAGPLTAELFSKWHQRWNKA